MAQENKTTHLSSLAIISSRLFTFTSLYSLIFTRNSRQAIWWRDVNRPHCGSGLSYGTGNTAATLSWLVTWVELCNFSWWHWWTLGHPEGDGSLVGRRLMGGVYAYPSIRAILLPFPSLTMSSCSTKLNFYMQGVCKSIPPELRELSWGIPSPSVWHYILKYICSFSEISSLENPSLVSLCFTLRVVCVGRDWWNKTRPPV